jgi:hypothetical protein
MQDLRAHQGGAATAPDFIDPPEPARRPLEFEHSPTTRAFMQLFLDLFTTDYGLVALAVTVISLGLAAGFHAFIRKKIRESESQ